MKTYVKTISKRTSPQKEKNRNQFNKAKEVIDK